MNLLELKKWFQIVFKTLPNDGAFSSKKKKFLNAQKEEGKVQGHLNNTDSSQYINDLKDQIAELTHEVTVIKIYICSISISNHTKIKIVVLIFFVCVCVCFVFD